MNEQLITRPDGTPLVVVGSSAGGIEALSVLVSTLPTNFPAPIVLAQHLDPHRPSQLEAILGQHSALPVIVVEDRIPLEPGILYVVPSDRHVAIRERRIRLEDGHAAHPRPSVDLLLSTAARTYGEDLVAIILTGSGSDGAAGAVEVHNAGGTVIIQDPLTARYPSMPLALPPTAVDYCLELDHIAPFVSELLQGSPLWSRSGPSPEIQSEVDDGLRELLELVRQRTEVDFQAYRPSTILRRLGHRMALTGHKQVHEYRQYLDQHPQELGHLVMAFLIGVTEFFRDPGAFAYLKSDILPQLIARARERDRVLRLWSAGCGTGEEAYSLAMLVSDLLGEELPQWHIKIFATDVNEQAITFARRGLYPEPVLRHLPEGYRERFFTPGQEEYGIEKSIRNRVIFGQQDLTRGVPFPRIDLVLCRNLLIYFTPELQRRVLDTFAYSLFEGGILFLGKAETIPTSVSLFSPVHRKWKVYQCTHRPPLPGRSAVAGPDAPHLPGEAEGLSLDAAALPLRPDTARLRRFGNPVFQQLSIGLAIVDRGYRLVSINVSARRLLGIHDGGPDQDFLHALRGLPYADVRAAIDSAVAQNQATTLSEMPLEASSGVPGRFLTLTLAPVRDQETTTDLVAIHVEDVTELVQARKQLDGMREQQVRLVQEVQATINQLSAANGELLDSNARLVAANEALTEAQEELQARAEEYQTIHEELQAANEELETGNEQLQAANEELVTTNDELVTRTRELEETAASLANERLRLAKMVEQAPFYILILYGPDLRVVAFNTRATGLLGGREILGRPVAEVFAEAGMAGFLTLVRQTYRQGVPQTTSRMDTTLVGTLGEAVPATFVYHLVPTYDSPGTVDGVIVYAEDVSEQVAREAQRRRDDLRVLVDGVDPVGLALFDAQSLQLLYASRRYTRLTGQAGSGTPAAGVWPDFPFLASAQEARDLLASAAQQRTTLHLPDVRLSIGPEDDDTVWDWKFTPVLDHDKPEDVRYIAFSMVDVTDQARAREQLLRLDRLREEFLVLASHELRTPLTVLTGYTQMLSRIVQRAGREPEPAWDPKIGEYVDKVEHQLRTLGRLIGDLTDVARLQHGKFSLVLEPVDLVRVLDQAIEEGRMFRPGLPIRLTVVEADRPCRIRGDDGRLIQVVSNLLQNAIKYAPSGEGIDVRLRCVDGTGLPLPGGEGEAPSDGGATPAWAQIEVQDYGPGLSAEELPLLFTRYYQATQKDAPARSAGLGMGLFLARAIVEQHGGTLIAQSTLGQGTTFVMRLPVMEESDLLPPA